MHEAESAMTTAIMRRGGWPPVAAGWLVIGATIVSTGYLLDAERGLMGAAALAIMLAVLAMIFGRMWSSRHNGTANTSAQPCFLADLDQRVIAARKGGLETACIVLLPDGVEQLLEHHGRTMQIAFLREIGARLTMALRPDDRITMLEGGGFAVAIAPSGRLDLATTVRLASHLQSVVAAPVMVRDQHFIPSCTVGICRATCRPGADGAALLDAAQVAAAAARDRGPGTIQVFAPGMVAPHIARAARRRDLEAALDSGRIAAWFQPQVSTDTGQVTGFETLARWQHPDQGVLAPGTFLPDIMTSGLSERLSEVMLTHALTALASWDQAGLTVPVVGVNFSDDELRNPRLVDKLKWELDRHDLAPERLAIEVLETVTTTGSTDMIVHNIAALARLGCRIDLDDFGTGSGAIANIRQLSAHRLKLDRSMVAGIDVDREQQRMVAAILALADHLDLETLAEGVENRGELAILAQLGCGHVQGFAIGRPMPLAATAGWIAEHQRRSEATFNLGRLPGRAAR